MPRPVKQSVPPVQKATTKPLVSITIEPTTGAVTATAPSMEILGQTLEKFKAKAAAA
jgi:hypothetical protein